MKINKELFDKTREAVQFLEDQAEKITREVLNNYGLHKSQFLYLKIYIDYEEYKVTVIFMELSGGSKDNRVPYLIPAIAENSKVSSLTFNWAELANPELWLTEFNKKKAWYDKGAEKKTARSDRLAKAGRKRQYLKLKQEFES